MTDRLELIQGSVRHRMNHQFEKDHIFDSSRDLKLASVLHIVWEEPDPQFYRVINMEHWTSGWEFHPDYKAQLLRKRNRHWKRLIK